MIWIFRPSVRSERLIGRLHNWTHSTKPIYLTSRSWFHHWQEKPHQIKKEIIFTSRRPWLLRRGCFPWRWRRRRRGSAPWSWLARRPWLVRTSFGSPPGPSGSGSSCRTRHDPQHPPPGDGQPQSWSEIVKVNTCYVRFPEIWEHCNKCG